MRHLGSTPFDLGRPPLFRVVLYRLDDEEYVLFVCVHHIVADNWSFGVMSHEVAAFYGAAVSGGSSDLPELELQHVDFVRWHRQWLAGDAITAQLEYWKRQLAGLPVTELPADHARPAVLTDRGASLIAPIPAHLAEGVDALCREQSASPFMVMLAAFYALLHRYTGAEDIVVGVPIANRNRLQSEAFIASFVNTLVLRVDLSGDPSFRELVARVRETALGAVAHQDVPFERIVEEMRPRRDQSRSPLFQILFNVQNAPLSVPDFAGIHAEVVPIARDAAQFDLSFSVDSTVTRHVTVEYNTDLFDADRIERLLDHYWALLAGAVVDAGCGVGVLPLLSGGELAELEGWAGSVGGGVGGVGVGGLFEGWAAVAPGGVAVRFEGECLSFGELNVRANRLARHLVSLGVGAGELVGVWLERSVEMVVAVLAVVKSGGAFVPLDPAFPADRLDFMVADSGVGVVVTDSVLLGRGGLGAGLEYVCVDRDAGLIGGYSGEDLGLGGAGGDLAYVIYTSGSTGRPKGVQVEHRSLANLLVAMAARPGLAAGDVVLSVTTLSFDIALLELLLPLVVGAEVVVVGRDTAADGAALAAELVRSGATMMQATPATWRVLIEAGWRGDGRLKALCGGEAMSSELADQLLARCGSVWNMYGPTETTVWSAVEEVTAGEGPVPIGLPIDNTRLYVLDARCQLVPVGVPGELFIGGEGVARGYLGRPELTAARFVADPFGSGPGARMYRTGDLVRRVAGGDIEFLGRVDAQLKVRGYRIEPGEIESVLVEHPDVAQAVVAAHDHGAGDTRLTAYVIAADPAVPPQPEGLRAYLRAKLPDYMVPASYVALAVFPTTPNNKIDRARLPRPDAGVAAVTRSSAPRPGLEAELAGIWERVLGVNGIGRDDDFFDLGGHSLLALRVFTRVEALTGRRRPLSALFGAPTIARFAALLQADEGQPRWTSLVPVQSDGTRRPFFYVAPFLITALSFSHLARHLGPDQPLYVIQPQGMEHDLPFHTSIEEMAAHYVKEMKEVQPSGPYWLGGHCAGSWVAFEMARQLQARGDEIGLLVLVDSEPPGSTPSTVGGPRYIASRLAAYRREGRLFEAAQWKLSVLFEQVVVGRMGRGGKQRQRVAELRGVHARAHRAYQGGPARGDALLVRSSEYARLQSKDWHLQWDQLLSGRLDVAVVPGTHAGLSQDAAEIAKTIRMAMDSADTDSADLVQGS
jgi:amino acid adenylation domain-containing protein